jgi:hypothetical protein
MMIFRADGGVELLIDSTRIFAARSAAIWLFISASKGDITIVTEESRQFEKLFLGGHIFLLP